MTSNQDFCSRCQESLVINHWRNFGLLFSAFNWWEMMRRSLRSVPVFGWSSTHAFLRRTARKISLVSRSRLRSARSSTITRSGAWAAKWSSRSRSRSSTMMMMISRRTSLHKNSGWYQNVEDSIQDSRESWLKIKIKKKNKNYKVVGWAKVSRLAVCSRHTGQEFQE